MTVAGEPSAIVLSEGATASTEYFLFPYLNSLGYCATLLDTRVVPSESLNVSGCRMVVISRYLPSKWLGVLEELRRQGIKIVYFMDDDLFDLRALQGLPWRYKWKIVSQALLHRRRLQRLCSDVWVSTAYLAEKYAGLRPVLLQPMPSLKTLETPKSIHVCYHGTASHQKEIEWLLPIVKAVQERMDHIHFELFGTQAVHKIFRTLPRVSILHPMSWPNYLSFTSVQKRDLALAPLLPGAFNAARGPTKFYDYARMGAVGLYSDHPPYRGFINDGVDGALLENDPGVWADALTELAGNHAKRERMAAEVRRRVDEMPRNGNERNR